MASKLSHYIWFFDTILHSKRISQKEIEKKWELSPFYDGKKLSRSTFVRWKEKAEEIFDINIECEIKGGYCYYIEDNDKINKDNDLRVWLLENYHISNILNSSISIRDKIITENNPSAKNFLFEITTAIKENSALEFTYKKYGENDVEETIYGLPLGLKQYKQRWYMLFQKGTDKIRIYGLDRISDLKIVPNAENTPKMDITPATYWHNYYGIYTTNTDKHPDEVKLKVSPRFSKFLRSLPLHHSQNEVETNEEFSIFTYQLCIEQDFISEILSNGTDIEVLEPQSLREEVSATIRKMLGKYEL